MIDDEAGGNKDVNRTNARNRDFLLLDLVYLAFCVCIFFCFGLAEIIKDENTSGKKLLIAAISLLVILAGVVFPTFS